MPKTLEEIRQAGLEALRERLGRAGMVRFLQQFENGRGDYVQERQTWVNQTSLNEIRDASRQRQTGRKGTKRRKG